MLEEFAIGILYTSDQKRFETYFEKNEEKISIFEILKENQDREVGEKISFDWIKSIQYDEKHPTKVIVVIDPYEADDVFYRFKSTEYTK